METVALYAYQVYKKGSFTKAAKDLYISQPSLSAAISRLEAELGFRIFDRSTIPCSLTAEGRIYMESLEEIIESESNMRKRIRELSDVDHGSITVGGASFASYLILSEVCAEFHRKYPKVSVTLDIGNVGSVGGLSEKLENNEIDGLITYSPSAGSLVSEPLIEERLIIAMHKSLPGAEKLAPYAVSRDEILSKRVPFEREISDTTIFKEIEFLEYPRRSETEQRMARILGGYKASRYKIENARHSEMHYNLMCAGIGAALISSLAVEQKPYNENVLFFLPKSEESYRQIYLAYNSASNSNSLIKRFIEEAKAIYSEK